MRLEGTARLFFQAQNRLQKAELYLMPTDLLVCQHIKKHECDPNVLCLAKPRESITALKSSNTFTPVYEQTKIQGAQTVKGFLKQVLFHHLYQLQTQQALVLHADWMQIKEASAHQLHLKAADVQKPIIPSLDQSQVEPSSWAVKGNRSLKNLSYCIILGPHR